MLVKTAAPLYRPTLSVDAACVAADVSRRTIYNWLEAGKVEYVRTAGGSIRIFADTLWRQEAADVVESALQDPRPGAGDPRGDQGHGGGTVG